MFKKLWNGEDPVIGIALMNLTSVGGTGLPLALLTREPA